MILFKVNLIPYPSIPNSSSLGNFFIVKFMIENRNFSKIAPFATLPIFHIFSFRWRNQPGNLNLATPVGEYENLYRREELSSRQKYLFFSFIIHFDQAGPRPYFSFSCVYDVNWPNMCNLQNKFYNPSHSQLKTISWSGLFKVFLTC